MKSVTTPLFLGDLSAAPKMVGKQFYISCMSGNTQFQIQFHTKKAKVLLRSEKEEGKLTRCSLFRVPCC